MKPKTSQRKRISPSLLLILALGFLTNPSAHTASLSNQLQNHASPYLALHGNDPVQWQDWGEAVIQRAKSENKLIFISSGYFSCHWCHVMQRESFSDPAIAKQLHDIALPVKIDRELQPALDAWLIDFTERTSGQAGWPLNVFLTPDGYPLVGMTYLPKDNFSRVLVSLNKRWAEDEPYLRETAQTAFQSMKPTVKTYSGKRPDKETAQQLTQYLIRHTMLLADTIQGGFGDQNKFPMSPQLLALINAYERTQNEGLGSFLTLTLDQMANLGLRDHIGGGFYRYVIDPGWDIPHFEKMLYDNAQLARVYLHAADTLNKPQYLEIAIDTLDFVIDRMQQEDGAYIASLSAVDDKDVEGGYYLWHTDELGQLLSKEELAVVKTVWDADGPPHLEDGYHLKQTANLAEAAAHLNMPITDLRNKLASAKQKLKQTRSQRSLPVDNKVLAAWNGLLLISLSEAAAKTGKQAYRDAAQKLYQYLTQRLWDGNQLYRFVYQGSPGGNVSLEDYAHVSMGIVAWAKASNDKGAWDQARQISLAGLKKFHNSNGWQPSTQMLVPYDARQLVLTDDTLPSPSATLLEALLNIAQHNEDALLKNRVLDYVDPAYDELTSSPLWYGSYITMVSAWANKNDE